MILIVDNYDSFTFNLYQYIGSINPDILVVKNDELHADEIKKLNPSHIIISPGPGFPKTSGYIEEIIKELPEYPILGVCLGHQAICEVYGSTITHAKELMHGKRDLVDIKTDNPLFKGLNNKINVARYHSLIATNIPESLEVIATSNIGEVMAVKHKKYNTYGVQFHPESIMTDDGMKILRNFLEVK